MSLVATISVPGLRLLEALATRVPPITSIPIKEDEKTPNLKVNGLVLVVDSSAPRGHWPVAVIESVKFSDDGLVRSADVRTATGVKRRPFTSLVRLEND